MKENSPSALKSSGLTPTEAIAAQVDVYAKTSRTCGHKLLGIYTDLGLHNDEQQKELHDVSMRACMVWSEAVEEAESKRTALRMRIDECYKESQKIKCQLGDNMLEEDCQSLVLSPTSPKKPLHALYQEEKERLDLWRTRKAERVDEYSKRQGDVNRLKLQLGLHVMPPTKQPDISRSNMDYLQLEFDKLTDMKAKKLEELGKLLVLLDEACAELEEEPDVILKEVHHSLRFNREASGGHLRQSVVESILSNEAEVDLSEKTFHSILGRIQDLRTLKDERKARARDLLEVLNSLWNALDTPDFDPSRTHFTKLLTSPARLHGRILESAMAEVRKLQEAKTQLMIDLIAIKKKELEAQAAATRLPLPNLDPLLSEIHASRSSSGQAAEVLAKLVRMTAQLTEQAEQRRPLLEVVLRLESMRQEAEWLREYEADPHRLKGRDAHKNLQRSLRAIATRDKLPAEIAAMRGKLNDWWLHYNCTFALDGAKDYLADVLDPLDEELKQLAESKSSRGRDRRQAPAASNPTPREGSSWSSGTPKTPIKGGSTTSLRGEPTTPRGGGGSLTPRGGAARALLAAARPSSTTARSPQRPCSAMPTRTTTSTAMSPPPSRARSAVPKPSLSEPGPPTARPLTPPPRTKIANVDAQVEKLIGRKPSGCSQLSISNLPAPLSPAESVGDTGNSDVSSRLDILSPTGRNKVALKQRLASGTDSDLPWQHVSPANSIQSSPSKLKDQGLNFDLPR